MLELHRLSKTYPNGTEALSSFSLDIHAGEAVAIVGGSGCGKSTLLRLIAGLESATSGTRCVDGDEITEPHPKIGLVFQEPRLLPWLSIEENVAFGLEGLDITEKHQRVYAALRSVGLDHQGKKWPREMSGGMAQRVALARALVVQPSVLLLDEPFSALDALTRSRLQDHLVRLWEETRMTLVLVTHDIEEALVVANRVIVLKPHPGRIDDMQEVSLTRPRNRDDSSFEAAKRELRNKLDQSLVVPKRAFAG